jgi:hypothetical protein
VSYNVGFGGGALVQLNGLPAVAFDALLERADDAAELIRTFDITWIG